MSDRESLDTGLRSIFASLAAGSHTALIGMVQTYNSATMRAEIQPVQMKMVNGIPTALPVLVDVPVLFPSNGSFHVVFNLLPGSFVLCVIAEHAIDQWLTMGSIAPPGNSRRCDLSDAVAIPGLFPTPGVLVPPCATGALEIRNSVGTTMMSLTTTGIEFTGPVTFKNTVHAYAVPNVPGTIVDLATHIHPTPAGNSSAPTPVPG